MQQELHIIEEDNNLIWGLIILIFSALGTYLLDGAFVNIFSAQQITAFISFLISFIGLFKLTEDKYHLALRFEGNILNIEISKGRHTIDNLKIDGSDIAALEFRPERSRSSGEARFDYSRSYHLMWRKANEVSYQKLLALNSTDITLQVDDIADIMRYIKKRVPEADIPIEQASFFNL